MCGVLLAAPAGRAQSIVFDRNEQRVFEEFNWVPYAFFSESFGLGLGVAGSLSAWPQEPSSILGAATIGTKGSYNFMASMPDFQVPAVPRLVIEPFFMLGRYQDQRLYIGRNPEFGGERAGSNTSDPDHFILATQWDNRAELKLRYLLPMGHGRDTIVSRYVVENGLLVRGASGGDAWNPMTSGRTSLSLTPGWRSQTLQQEDLQVPFETFNIELALEYDNYDFPFNPSRGSYQRMSYKIDLDSDPNLGGWEVLTAEANKVFDLGSSERSFQRVIALGIWTAYVPTWESEIIDGVEVVTRRTPHFEGATLGGLYRMRAYEDNRFQDKAAIWYTAEYRTVPSWQPLKNIQWLDWADISWWQWVVFAEAGQVAPSYSLDELHSDLHADGGISLRAMIHKAVCRLDFAAGEEGARVTAMYGHPF